MSKGKILVILLLFLWSAQVKGQEETIKKGVKWLIFTQNPSGSWGIETEYPNLAFINTTLIADTLHYLGFSGSPAALNAIQWIKGQVATCSRHLSYQIVSA